MNNTEKAILEIRGSIFKITSTLDKTFIVLQQQDKRIKELENKNAKY